MLGVISRPDFLLLLVGETRPPIVSGKNTGNGCGIENSNGQLAEKKTAVGLSVRPPLILLLPLVGAFPPDSPALRGHTPATLDVRQLPCPLRIFPL
jgi:hypothetical protein